MGPIFLLSPAASLAFTPESLDVLASAYSPHLKHPHIQIEVDLYDLASMEALNSETRHLSEPTDVLSFPSLPTYEAIGVFPKEMPLLLGSIIICPQKASEYHESLLELLHHGMLHLMGYDHERDLTAWDKIEENIITTLREKNMHLRSRQELSAST